MPSDSLLPQPVDRLSQLDHHLSRYLPATRRRDHHGHLAALDPAIERRLAGTEDPCRPGTAERRTNLPFERASDRGDLLRYLGHAFSPAQAHNAVDQGHGLTHLRHTQTVADV